MTTTEPAPTNEIRVFGPPGTGKTTWLSGSIRATAKKRHTSQIVVASFTRAAAAEIAGRGLPLHRSQVGTLHSLAYRAIGHPTVAEEHLSDWNKTHPALALSAGYKSMEESPLEWRGSTDGDVLQAELDTLRARLRPQELWPRRVVLFERQWSKWKAEHQVVDFTDMIDLALQNTEEAPGSPVVGFFDEFQDFTPLEIALVRKWGRRMERLIVAGDDDQCIYSFKGATPDAFLDPPIPEENKYVLSQSYRVPVEVHKRANAWVHRLTRREVKDYEPRDEEGRVRLAPYRTTDPQPLVRDVMKQVDDGRTVMILATCAYMLDQTKHAMRAEGLPFHNPFRRSRGDWNPLKASRGTSAADKLLAYLIIDERIFGELSRLWTGQDVKRWAAVIKTKGIFRRGAKGAIAGLPDRELTFEEVAALFESDEELEIAATPDLAWFSRNLLASARQTMEYPILVAKRRGPLALTETPRVVLGTIHSVKGGQADVVYLFPDLSLAGYRSWAEHGAGRDSVIRQMYVGMTRAREELVLCSQSSQTAVDPALMYQAK